MLVGTGNDLDAPGFLQSFDPETGKLQWKFYTVPMNPGDPGLDTWPSLDAARHGGGQVWIPGAYDPETKLYIFGTGNPTPGYTGRGRQGRQPVHLLAGRRATSTPARWRGTIQTSPHDTHDWDSAQTPILIDGTIDGRPRKLVSTAARNGYFFTLDRVTGEHVVTTQVRHDDQLGQGPAAERRPEPDPAKEATIPGSLVSPVEGGVTNWPPPAFSPDTGLFYVQENNGFNILYLTDPDPRGSMGLRRQGRVGGRARPTTRLRAIDYKTGKTVWRHAWPPGGGGGAGMLATAGGAGLHGRRQRQLRRVRRDQREAAVAHAHRQHHQRAADLPARRDAVRARRRRRSPLLVRPGPEPSRPIRHVPLSTATAVATILKD